MDFSLSDDRRMLQETVERYVREQYDHETRMKIAGSEDGTSSEKWAEMAELGLVGAFLPEEAGGFGGAGYDIVVVMKELGRGIVVEPFLATAVMGAGAIAVAGTDAQKAMLEEVIAGAKTLAFAHGEPASRYDYAHVETRAEKSGDGWTLTGAKAVVPNGDGADMLVVSARVSGDAADEAGLALFLVDASAEGVERRGYPTVDGYRAAEITLSNVKVGADGVLGEPGAAYDVIEQVIARGVLALCAEATGAMETARDLTLEYLKQRNQFGQPIGRFQALQHRMVDVCMEIEQANSAVTFAAASLEAPRAERERALSAAKSLIGRVGRLVAEEAIQLHGGNGMTWEYAIPHYCKRLTMIDHMLGDTDHHLERFIRFNKAA
ncbi:MAG: acyl-CoA dehydrogenase family protein [Pseudomonadota bacterium]